MAPAVAFAADCAGGGKFGKLCPGGARGDARMASDQADGRAGVSGENLHDGRVGVSAVIGK